MPKNFKINQAHYFLFFLLFVILFFCYQILYPYLNPIILALIFATVFRPIHEKIEKLVRGRKNLAAFLSCTLLTLVVVLPLTMMLIALIHQGVESFNAIYAWIAAGKLQILLEKPLVAKTIGTVQKYLPDLHIPELSFENFKVDQSLLKISSAIGRFLINQGGQIVGNITAMIGKFFLMIFAFFFVIRDQEKFFETVLHLIPLSRTHENEIISKIKAVSKSVLLGTFVTAMGQGAAGGFAFWIADLPGLFWGTAMAFSSLIPIVGTTLIWVPAAIYLFISGRGGYGLFMVIWCAVVIGMIDNFVRPLFMKDSANMSTMLIFFSILGGINYFGLIGLLYGPLIFGLAIVLLYIYSLEFEAFLSHQDKA